MKAASGRTSAAALLALLALGNAQAATDGDRRLGERIYRAGLNARGEPVRALVGLPPAALTGEHAACAACHTLGDDAAAQQPSAAPDLAWPALVRSAEAKGARTPYSEAAFGRAVSEGIATAGGLLSTAMPRYALSRGEIAALAAYLKRPSRDAKSR